MYDLRLKTKQKAVRKSKKKVPEKTKEKNVTAELLFLL